MGDGPRRRRSGTSGSLALGQLAARGADEAASFAVELVVSALVTNAIRHRGAPLRLRLIRERGLILEVSDGGHTSSHLRRAAMEDEGGRGLFLLANSRSDGETRYTPTGKTIRTEVSPASAQMPGAFAGEQFQLYGVQPDSSTALYFRRSALFPRSGQIGRVELGPKCVTRLGRHHLLRGDERPGQGRRRRRRQYSENSPNRHFQ